MKQVAGHYAYSFPNFGHEDHCFIDEEMKQNFGFHFHKYRFLFGHTFPYWLDGFGSFRLSFSGTGEAEKDDVTASSIKDIHILFEPDEAIKERVNKTKVHQMGLV